MCIYFLFCNKLLVTLQTVNQKDKYNFDVNAKKITDSIIGGSLLLFPFLNNAYIADYLKEMTRFNFKTFQK